jgi:hypothetical protein
MTAMNVRQEGLTMRTTRLIGILVCLTMAGGCTSSPQRVEGEAGPAGVAPSSAAPTPAAVPALSSSPSPAPSRAASPAKTASPPSAAAPVPVLGPNGFGALRLGISRRQAEATGLISPFEGTDGDGCALRAHLRASAKADVYYSGSLGVEIIEAYAGVRTPEGIRIGSSLAAVRRAYPDWFNVAAGSEKEKYTDGRGLVAVPGNSKAHYRIVTLQGRVAELTLQYRNQNC